MQVTRRTQRWPFVIALVGLLLFCLTVPRYWRTTQGNEEAAVVDRPGSGALTHRRSRPHDAVLDLADLVAQADAEEAAAANASGDATASAAPSAPAATSQSAKAASGGSLAAGQPLKSVDDDEILARLSIGLASGSARSDYSISYPGMSWPSPSDVILSNPDISLNTTLPAATTPLAAAPPFEPLDIQPQLASVFENLGQAVVHCAPKTTIARIALSAIDKFRAVDFDWPVISESPAVVASTPAEHREAGPKTIEAAPALELLADAPAAEPTAPAVTATIWSRPDLLLSQLERLALQPFAAQWANDTLTQLKTLAEGPRRDAGQTAALLDRLDKSAESAVRLAEQTDNEALCVELLRAHWALERRLDCWTAMRDIRLAAISDTRIASRGPLGPLFRGAADALPSSNHLESLSAGLEAYEQTRDPELGRHVALVEQQLRSSSDDLDQALADAVENNYRNANVRVAITADLLNRFVSQQRAEARPVRERIAGTPVRGQSATMSWTRVELQPTIGRWQLALYTQGTVESDTSSVGRAQVFTHGSTQFVAETPITVEADGSVHLQPSSVDAENCSQLLGVSTGLDWIPLVGGFARQEAINQYKQKRPQAKAEVEYKVENRTMERVDARTGELVNDIRQQVEQSFTNPLAKYSVEITPLEMATTTQRSVARLRVAGKDQLAGHTPRPRALSDSLASLQVHESALTNAAVSLELNAERLTAGQLQTKLREKLPRLALEQPPEAKEDTIFQFAAQDAVQFHINDGRLELAIAITEFVQEDQHVRNFIVHAFYKPVVSGLTAELVRDGALGIEGVQRQIGAGDRALLYNVFKVVLGEERRLPVFRLENPDDPRLAGLMITQLVLEDGWLGVSVGPVTNGRVAECQRSLR